MKVKRYKKIRKVLHSYEITHNIKAPYKIALDGEFIQSALLGQIMLKEQLPKLVQEERTTVYVTPCIDNWLRLKGGEYSGALHIATKLDHLKCRHPKGFVRPFECIKHLVANGNPDRLLIGAQDDPIKKLIRHTPGVPLFIIHGSTIILESPTDTTKGEHIDHIQQQQNIIKKEEQKQIQQAAKELKQEAAAASSTSSSVKKPLPSANKKKRKKGPSQPNPLSMKKKKTAPTPPSNKKKLSASSTATSTSTSASTTTSSSTSSTTAGNTTSDQPKKKQKVSATGAPVNVTSSTSTNAVSTKKTTSVPVSSSASTTATTTKQVKEAGSKKRPRQEEVTNSDE